MQNEIYKIIQGSLDNEYGYGTNDCNLTVLKIIDVIAGTTLANRTYSNIKEGIAGLKKDGFNNTGEVVEKYCDEVKYTIDGDIWLDPDNPLIMAVVASNRIVAVNEDHTGFVLMPKPTNGKYYRVRKQ
ncbi:ornithine carbamoyltransferase [Phytobacter diazotrophicus]|uniref:DUF6950 family protein n=1 Tax=Phytobacter diazotrophicus TaxID=395631 RepID=UPI002935E318|nr:ornithine carbamoyltransferase [Phytobacter diazotrophicus]MDV2904906.1 ornithine carbamoyltransferase [Phytobacter diazotrophicus]